MFDGFPRYANYTTNAAYTTLPCYAEAAYVYTSSMEAPSLDHLGHCFFKLRVYMHNFLRDSKGL